jgi:hypothetical protein
VSARRTTPENSAGMRTVEDKQDDFHNVDGTPSWHEIARFCQSNSGHLRGNEREFVNDMASSTVWREPTERQAKCLRSILYRLGGRL